MAGDPVPAAAHCDQKPVVAGEVNCGNHISDAVATHDDARPLIDHAVPDASGRIVLRVIRQQHRASQSLSQADDR